MFQTLKMIPLSTSQSYLFNDSIRTVFLYKFSQVLRDFNNRLQGLQYEAFRRCDHLLANNSLFAQDIRHVWALVDATSSTGSFFIVQRGDVSMPNMDRVYAQVYEEE